MEVTCCATHFSKTKLWRAEEEDLQAFPQLLRHNVLVTGHPHNCRTPALNPNTALCPNYQSGCNTFVSVWGIKAFVLKLAQNNIHWSLPHLMIKAEYLFEWDLSSIKVLLYNIFKSSHL